jgi:hypothetical protein
MPDPQVKEWQSALRNAGYNVAVDGDFGPKTLEASLASLHEDLPPPIDVPYEIPQDWMPPSSKMVRIIAHWTAGSYNVSSTDKEHYHFIWTGDGGATRGDNSVTDNENTGDGDYAAHTKGCNTGSIGVSVACMAGAVENPFKPGNYPMTRAQWDGMVRGIAQLCDYYHIPVTPTTVLSHAEVEENLNIDQSGKWDFTRLAWDTTIYGAASCGNLLRSHVKALL